MSLIIVGIPPSTMRLVASWKLVLLLFITAAVYVSTVSGYILGAPVQACTTLSPDPGAHGAPPQTTTVPYEIDMSVFGDDNSGQLLYTPATAYQSKNNCVCTPCI